MGYSPMSIYPPVFGTNPARETSSLRHFSRTLCAKAEIARQQLSENEIKTINGLLEETFRGSKDDSNVGKVVMFRGF